MTYQHQKWVALGWRVVDLCPIRPAQGSRISGVPSYYPLLYVFLLWIISSTLVIASETERRRLGRRSFMGVLVFLFCFYLASGHAVITRSGIPHSFYAVDDSELYAQA